MLSVIFEQFPINPVNFVVSSPSKKGQSSFSPSNISTYFVPNQFCLWILTSLSLCRNSIFSCSISAMEIFLSCFPHLQQTSAFFPKLFSFSYRQVAFDCSRKKFRCQKAALFIHGFVFEGREGYLRQTLNKKGFFPPLLCCWKLIYNDAMEKKGLKSFETSRESFWRCFTVQIVRLEICFVKNSLRHMPTHSLAHVNVAFINSKMNSICFIKYISSSRVDELQFIWSMLWLISRKITTK